MLAAVAAFSLMDAAMKRLGQHYSPLQVTSMRGFASLPVILLWVAAQNRWRELRPVRWSLHLLRGVLAVAMLGLFIYSVHTLSLASAYSVFLCGPLLVTALSVPLLKEHVDARRWIAIGIGMIGVVIIMHPTTADLATLGAVAAFAAAVCYALGAVMIRRISRTETTLGMSFSFLLLIAVLAGLMAAHDWIAIETRYLGWIALLGIAGTIGQYCIIEAFRNAPAAVVAPFDYTALLWGAILDWILWRTLPTERMLLGGGIVMATGLYLIHRERVVRKDPAAT